MRDLQGKSIATSYPIILNNFLSKHNVTADIHEISGSVEIAPGIGLAEAHQDGWRLCNPCLDALLTSCLSVLSQSLLFQWARYRRLMMRVRHPWHSTMRRPSPYTGTVGCACREQQQQKQAPQSQVRGGCRY